MRYFPLQIKIVFRFIYLKGGKKLKGKRQIFDLPDYKDYKLTNLL
jgi:hypothetical protein